MTIDKLPVADILKKHRVDLDTILIELEDLRQRTKNGIMQEKVSAKDGVLQVIECYPAIEYQILRFKADLLEKYSPKEEQSAQLELILTDLTGQQLFS